MAKTAHGDGLDLRGSAEKMTGNGSSYGPDPEEVNGSTGETQVDRYGFTGGAQQSSGDT